MTGGFFVDLFQQQDKFESLQCFAKYAIRTNETKNTRLSNEEMVSSLCAQEVKQLINRLQLAPFYDLFGEVYAPIETVSAYYSCDEEEESNNT
jgi:hypothetical protein